MIDKNFWSAVATRWKVKDTTGRTKAVKEDVSNITNQSSGDIPEELMAFGVTDADLDEIDDFFDDI